MTEKIKKSIVIDLIELQDGTQAYDVNHNLTDNFELQKVLIDVESTLRKGGVSILNSEFRLFPEV